jgi:hypothetical protein
VFSKKVDDSKNQLVALTEELEATKTKIEKMTYAGLPQSIASLIRNGEKVPASKAIL